MRFKLQRDSSGSGREWWSESFGRYLYAGWTNFFLLPARVVAARVTDHPFISFQCFFGLFPTSLVAGLNCCFVDRLGKLSLIP